LVPEDAAGFVIGRGGANLDRIKRETSATVGFSRGAAGKVSDRFVGISARSVGAREEGMRRVVEDVRVARRVEAREKSVFVVVVPSEVVAMVIGKGGATIREIRSSSGAEVDIVDEVIAGTSDKAVRLKGDLESTVRAVVKVSRAVDEFAEMHHKGPEDFPVPGWEVR
jgi:transcription antitermination factor NusA-like protein